MAEQRMTGAMRIVFDNLIDRLDVTVTGKWTAEDKVRAVYAAQAYRAELAAVEAERDALKAELAVTRIALARARR